MISEKTERRGIIEVTPLTIGAISVGVVVCILLIISVITLIVSRVRRKSRRRVQATRCQQAIRQFDAMNKNFGGWVWHWDPKGDETPYHTAALCFYCFRVLLLGC